MRQEFMHSVSRTLRHFFTHISCFLRSPASQAHLGWSRRFTSETFVFHTMRCISPHSRSHCHAVGRTFLSKVRTSCPLNVSRATSASATDSMSCLYCVTSCCVLIRADRKCCFRSS